MDERQDAPDVPDGADQGVPLRRLVYEKETTESPDQKRTIERFSIDINLQLAVLVLAFGAFVAAILLVVGVLAGWVESGPGLTAVGALVGGGVIGLVIRAILGKPPARKDDLKDAAGRSGSRTGSTRPGSGSA